MPDGRVRRRLSLTDIPIYTGRRGPRPSFSTGPELRRIKRSTHQSDATACADAKRPMRPELLDHSMRLTSAIAREHPLVHFGFQPTDRVERYPTMLGKVAPALEPPDGGPRQPRAITHRVESNESKRDSMQPRLAIGRTVL